MITASMIWATPYMIGAATSVNPHHRALKSALLLPCPPAGDRPRSWTFRLTRWPEATVGSGSIQGDSGWSRSLPARPSVESSPVHSLLTCRGMRWTSGRSRSCPGIRGVRAPVTLHSHPPPCPTGGMPRYKITSLRKPQALASYQVWIRVFSFLPVQMHFTQSAISPLRRVAYQHSWRTILTGLPELTKAETLLHKGNLRAIISPILQRIKLRFREVYKFASISNTVRSWILACLTNSHALS